MAVSPWGLMLASVRQLRARNIGGNGRACLVVVRIYAPGQRTRGLAIELNEDRQILRKRLRQHRLTTPAGARLWGSALTAACWCASRPAAPTPDSSPTARRSHATTPPGGAIWPPHGPAPSSDRRPGDGASSGHAPDMAGREGHGYARSRPPPALRAARLADLVTQRPAHCPGRRFTQRSAHPG